MYIRDPSSRRPPAGGPAKRWFTRRQRKWKRGSMYGFRLYEGSECSPWVAQGQLKHLGFGITSGLFSLLQLKWIRNARQLGGPWQIATRNCLGPPTKGQVGPRGDSKGASPCETHVIAVFVLGAQQRRAWGRKSGCCEGAWRPFSTANY